MTNNGKVLSARQTISYLLFFQGYLSILEAVRLLQRYHRNRWDRKNTWSLETGLHQAHLQVRYWSEVTNLPPGDWSRKDENDPLADLPFWLQDFTDNLEATVVHAPAHIAQDSDLEHPTKVVTKSRKHSIETHFPKDRNCDVCLRTKMTRSLCRRRTGEALPRAEIFGDFITADHKVLNEGCESRDNHWYAVVVQDFATQWVQSFACKTKSSHETEKTLNKSWNRRTDRKLFPQTTRWNLGEHVKFYHGITALQHLIDPRQMASLKEPSDEQRKVRQQYCYSQD